MRLLTLLLVASTWAPAAEDPTEFFERRIRPLLAEKCSACHGAKTKMAGLDLTSSDFLAMPASPVKSGDPAASRLIQVVGYRDKLKMPPAGRLADSEIQALTDWVAMGSPWPGYSVRSAVSEPVSRVPEHKPNDLFSAKIGPLFAAKCHSCHGALVQTAGLDLSREAGFRKGPATGPLVDGPGSPEGRLMRALSYDARIKMPPEGKLTEGQLADVRAWLASGAPWTENGKPTTPAPPPTVSEAFKPALRSHWAFQPVRVHPIPKPSNLTWISNDIDAFILDGLEAGKVTPAAPAAKAELLRRATYDLTGLPPTPDEVRSFLADDSPDAWKRVVDGLLNSPRYGEKWGRHWLDVARYGDTAGTDEDRMYLNAWRYRDYVIESFNRDVPYDRFVMEQIAGDLLPHETPEDRARGIVATGFLAVGPKPLALQDRAQLIYEVVDEQIEATSKAFLGITIACARCHDHKFDPILQRDYYSLAAIFASTRSFRNVGRPGISAYANELPLDSEESQRFEDHRRRMFEARLEYEDALASDERARIAKLGPSIADYLAAAWRSGNPAVVEKPYLQALRNATPQNVRSVAERYQQGWIEAARKWGAQFTEWRDMYWNEASQLRKIPAKPTIGKTVKGQEPPTEGELFFAETFFGDGPFSTAESARLGALRARWKSLEASLPEAPPVALAVEDVPWPIEQHIHLRGNHLNPGEVTAKGFPVILGGDRTVAFESRSGRLELAKWLTSPENPLTARVMVNRIWQWHFGEGLVRTPNNWGTTGEPPTHPELLDFLARRFIESGWSIKSLHRMILLSSTYRMSSAPTDGARAADPDNRRWSRFNRRRLTAEEIRDSLLFADGSLDLTQGGTLMKPFHPDPRMPINFEFPEAAVSVYEAPRRSVYLPLRRVKLPVVLTTFDFGDASTVVESRASTNVAPQALFMMNSRFVADRSRGLLGRARNETGGARVGEIYLRLFAREPLEAETREAYTYIDEAISSGMPAETAWQSYIRALISSNEFVYLN